MGHPILRNFRPLIMFTIILMVFRYVNRWRYGSRIDGPSGKNTTLCRQRNRWTPWPRRQWRRPRRSVAAAAVAGPSVRQRPPPEPSFSVRATTTRRWRTRRAVTAAWTRPSRKWSQPERRSRCRPRRHRRTRPRPARRLPSWPGHRVREQNGNT